MADRTLDLKLIINGDYKAGAAVNKTRADVQSISDQINTLQNRLSALLALKMGDIISGQVGALLRTADAAKTLDARLKLVSDTSSEYVTAQERVFQIAQKTRGELEATTSVYGKIETTLDALGGSQEQAFQTTTTLNQAIKLTSQGAQQDAAAIQQLGQALDSGVLRGDEFNSVMENSAGLAQALADGLGVPIGKLREMAENGELTSDRLINALNNAAGSVQQKFNALPLTVDGAMTKIGNAVTRYIAENDRATGASAKLAGTIETAADNLDIIVNVVTVLAELYGVKVVLGLSRATQSFIENAQAARTKAQADLMAKQSALALMQTEAQVAAIRQKATAVMLQEAQLYARLTAGSEKEAAAKTALAAALNQNQAAVTAAKTKQAELTAALDAGAVAATKTERAFLAINSAMQLAFAFDIGQTVGEWLRQFEAVRTAGAYVAEAMVMVQTGVHGMLDGIGIEESWAQIKQIHAQFNEIRAADTVQAEQAAAATTAAEQQKTQALEAAALKQQAAFKVVQEANKQLTASIDAEAKAQTAAIEQSLADRLAAIDATNVSEAEKDNLRVQAKLQAYQLEQQLQQQVAQEKLLLIDQEYKAELEQAASNAERLATIETQKRQAKLAVYAGLAEFYQGEVARLSQVYATEYQQAQQARQALQTLNRNHEQALFEISLSGLTEREKLSEREQRFTDTLRALKAEQAKGDQADQSKINELLAQAKQLHGEITTTAGKGSSAIYDAKKRETEIYQAEKTELEQNARAHEENAQRAQAAQAGVAKQLRDTQAALNDIAGLLNKDYAVKIGVNESSLAAVRSTIADLTKPETKVITIQTVNQGAPAQATGGPAGLPTGRPWRFNTGGYTPRSGQLPGFGGGDKIRALLEAGEFIVRKEAVQKLSANYGPGAMFAINQGQLPLGNVIKRAMGGSVGYNMDNELAKLQDEREKEQIKRMLANSLALGLGSTGGYSSTRAKRTIGQALEKMGRADLKQTASDIVDNSVGRVSRIGAGTKENASRNRAKFDRAKVLTEHLFDGDQAGIKTPSIQTPKINIPTPTVPRRPEPSTAGTRSSAGAGGTVTVQFKAPNGAGVSAQFDQNGDVKQMIEILKQAGARISGGPF